MKNVDRSSRSFAHGELTGAIIHACYEIYGAIGGGLKEAVYVRALAARLGARGLSVERERRFSVLLRGRKVGEVRADLDVHRLVIVEAKAAEGGLSRSAMDQLAACIRVSGRAVGLLVNFFGARPVVRRVVGKIRTEGGRVRGSGSKPSDKKSSKSAENLSRFSAPGHERYGAGERLQKGDPGDGTREKK